MGWHGTAGNSGPGRGAGDWGSGHVSPDSPTAHATRCTTTVPQVIEHKPYDEKADVFSFAVVLWELLTGKVRGVLLIGGWHVGGLCT